MKTLLLLLTLLSPLASARIGEDEGQLVARYGKPTGHPNPNKLVFEKGRALIVVSLLDGKCASIFFMARKEKPGDSESLSADELAALMAANGGDRKWVRKDSSYRSDDGELEASVSPDSQLTITNAAWRKEQERLRREEKLKGTLDGF